MPGRKPITQCTQAEWRELCRRGRASVAPPYGYTWRFIWSKRLAEEGEEGLADLRPRPGSIQAAHLTIAGKLGTAYVYVARGMSQTLTEDTFVHEMAHCLDSWQHDPSRGHHDSQFWCVVGRVTLMMRGEQTG